MKKLLIISLIFLIPLTLIGCASGTAEEQREEVTINMPKDDTVNGYRTKPVTDDSGDIVSADRVGVEDNKATAKSQNSTSDKSIQYCANTSSKTFHKADCGSVKNLKEENKYLTSNRDELLKDGYTPCKKCNP